MMDNSLSLIKATVGFCVKNSEGIVRTAINSLLDQDFPKRNMELIIIDGSSTDRTLDIIRECLTDTHLDVKIFSESCGLGIARQMVVEKASGIYIIWLDADMILPKSYIARQVEYMDRNSNVGIGAGKFAVHIGQGLAADLENIVYAVDSVYGEQSASKYGYLPGTEGAIFRVDAIRQIDGFDVNMNGAGEDTEVAFRMIKNGWKVVKTNVCFIESTRKSWGSLWSQYSWYGRGGHFVYHKNRDAIIIWKMTPLAGFIAGLLRLPKAYILTHKKFTFLLPVHYVFKRSAWFLGFLNAHLQGYGHKSKIKINNNE
jgi:glycosyltransferase involved in cell wall biosynthesis